MHKWGNMHSDSSVTILQIMQLPPHFRRFGVIKKKKSKNIPQDMDVS